jgi:thiamine kinase-like enzyme
MDPPDMRRHSLVTARALAVFHKKATHAAQEAGRWDGAPTGLAVCFDAWLRIATTDARERVLAQGKAEGLAKYDVDATVKECAWLLSVLSRPSIANALPVVVCHNDLLGGNCMASVNPSTGDISDTPDIRFIDFEYACKNVAMFDVGNHFNEWAGVDVEWALCPSEEEMAAFIKVYIEESTGVVPSDSQLQDLVVLAQFCQLASNAMWGLWALIQAAYSTIDFDYLDYGTQRWAQYRREKAKVEARLNAMAE